MATPQQKINGLGSMNIGGKMRPFHVNGLNHQEIFTQTLGIELDDYYPAIQRMAHNGALTNARTAVAFLYAALVAGCKRTEIDVDFTYQQVLNWIEDADERDAEVVAEMLKPLTLFGQMFSAKKNEEPAK